MTNSLSFEELTRTGRNHLKAGRTAEAVDALTEALRLNELDPEAHETLATACFLKQNYELAIQHFERVTRLDPRRGSAWINLGAVYNRMSNHQKAAEVLRRAVQIEPKSSIAYYNLGIAYKHLRQWALAVPAYRQAIRLDPQMADAYLNLGNVYMAMNNFTQAASHYRRALELKPTSERAQRGLEKAEAELQSARASADPLSRLAPPPAAATTQAAPPAESRELTEPERVEDRRQLTDILGRLHAGYEDLAGTLTADLQPAVTTLNKMLTQSQSPHGSPITPAEALEQFQQARTQYTTRLALFQQTLQEIRQHEAQIL